MDEKKNEFEVMKLEEVKVNQIHLSQEFMEEKGIQAFDYIKVNNLEKNTQTTLEVIPKEEGKARVSKMNKIVEKSITIEKIKRELINVEEKIIFIEIIENKSLNYVEEITRKSIESSLFYKTNDNWLFNVIKRKLMNTIVVNNGTYNLEVLGNDIIFIIKNKKLITDEYYFIDRKTKFFEYSNEDTNEDELINNMKNISLNDSIDEDNQNLIKMINKLKIKEETKIECKLKNIGGYQNEINKIYNLITKSFNKNNITSNSFVIHGNSGTGKTMIIKEMIAQFEETKVYYFSLNDGLEKDVLINEIMQKNDDGKYLIVFDDFEHLSKEYFTVVYSLFNHVQEKNNFCLVLITKNYSKIRNKFKMGGKLNDVFLPVPNEHYRKNILELYFVEYKIDWGYLEKVLSLTGGYVGKDLQKLCKLSFYYAKNNEMNWDHLSFSLEIIKPSQNSEYGINIPKTSFDEIGGYHEIKTKLEKTLYWPMKYPDKFEKLGLPISSGILLYGPSGNNTM
jgi:ATP-dependent 26S proteasome regulatory subunit